MSQSCGEEEMDMVKKTERAATYMCRPGAEGKLYDGPAGWKTGGNLGTVGPRREITSSKLQMKPKL